MTTRSEDNEAACSTCGAVVGYVVIRNCRITIDLTTDSHGTELPITCPLADE